MMADGWSSKTTGMDAVARRMRRIKRAPTISVRVGAVATTGKLKRVKGGSAAEHRTAGENITIFRTQAKDRRKVLFVDDHETEKGNEIWKKGVRKFQDRGDHLHLMRAGADLGKAMIEFYRTHIKTSKVARGSMRPVKPGTQKRKDREGLRAGLPPLIRTGQLLKSLVMTVRKS